jgi:uncharacterized membrane protein
MKRLLRWLLGGFLFVTGVGHFVVADEFIRQVPSWLPWPALLVSVSGVAELAGALGLQIERTRRWAAWGLVALFVAVFPANLHVALHDLSPTRMHLPQWVLWARLPFQLVFIVWAWWYTRDPTREQIRKMVRDIHTC